MAFHYCTYFDRNYLTKGLALYRSMARHFADFTLWVLCFDTETWEILSALSLPSVRLIRLEDFERDDAALAEAKAGRTPVEYYWTCTPSLPLFVFRQEPTLEGVIYLDADLMFYHHPGPILSELGAASILIHPHRYAPEYADRAQASGIYSVGMVAFRNDARGLACLNWWRERCNEWCYFRAEDGKLGDQKYLDDWPTRFAGVAVSEHPGVGLAPWNIGNYGLSFNGEQLLVFAVPLVFYHYHSFRPLGRGVYWLADYALTRRQHRLIYEPYLREMGVSMFQARRIKADFCAGYSRLSLRKYLALLRGRRLAFGLYGRRQEI